MQSTVEDCRLQWCDFLPPSFVSLVVQEPSDSREREKSERRERRFPFAGTCEQKEKRESSLESQTPIIQPGEGVQGSHKLPW